MTPQEALADPDWVRLAHIIREVDGNHDLGAGELAERILTRLASSGLSIAPTADLALDVKRLWDAMYDANQQHGGYECCGPPTHASPTEIAAEYARLTETRP